MTRFSECENQRFWSINYYIHGVADFVMVVIFVIVRLWLRGGSDQMSARGLLAKPATRQVMVYICVFLYQGYDILFYREAHCILPAVSPILGWAVS